MSLAAANAVFQAGWIPAILQHVYIVVTFKKGCMTLPEIMYDLFTRDAYISDHADLNAFTFDDKAVRIDSIMLLGESSHLYCADADSLVRLKRQYLNAV